MVRNRNKTAKEKQREQQEQKVLLNELESIKSLLTQDPADDIPTLDIPLLKEKVLDEPPHDQRKPDANANNQVNVKIDAEQRPENNSETELPPGQPSLFEEKQSQQQQIETKSTHQSQANNAVNPTRENPFLPNHIRNRLGKQTEYPNSNSLDYMQNPTAQLPPVTSTTHKTHAQLIDEIVAEYLPIIEDKLRAKLKQQLLLNTTEPLSEEPS